VARKVWRGAHARQDAISFSRNQNITHFLAVGGGSSMDTAKAANLFTCYPEADLMEFINAPIGRGTPIAKKLRPLIASGYFTFCRN
jgi:hydroxyacid-oxoacid transhydrogenase